MSQSVELLTLEQVAAESGVCVAAVRRWVRKGCTVGGKVVLLKARVRGTQVRVSREDLAAFDAECTAARYPAQAQAEAEKAESPAAARRRGKAAQREAFAALGGVS